MLKARREEEKKKKKKSRSAKTYCILKINDGLVSSIGFARRIPKDFPPLVWIYQENGYRYSNSQIQAQLWRDLVPHVERIDALCEKRRILVLVARSLDFTGRGEVN